MGEDIVFPVDNEEAFIAMADCLGYSAICFCYPFPRLQDKKVLIKALQKNSRIKLKLGALVTQKTLQKARGIADICIAKGPDVERALFESKALDMIFDLETANRKDGMHVRYSGLNQVLCKLMGDKGIALGISFASILSADEKRRAVIMGRISQNIRFAEKYKVPIIIASCAVDAYGMRSAHDLEMVRECLKSC